ncbi:unnamed protein product [Chondrus crispus]|uniref:Uncharacterized protein n=1 Tax=Chondrus crispus TaxID=2769 RepID=R7QCQ0_CHOCR|nr:unnamed protein product [Chondrus crispus]CDF35528.1 unnamed protein product [Chondrus crispus]|eukprot:XP_005715347.1 unnamed protein product [Chondrus crispus]
MVVDLCLRVQQEVRDAAEEDYAFREKLGALLERLGRRLPEEAQANLGKLGKEEGVCKQMVSIS